MPMTKAANPACVRKTAILAVSGNQTDLSMLRCLFAGSSWVLHTAGSLAEALESVTHTEFPVVLCEKQLPDGDWKALLQMVDGLQNPPSVVVTSRHADEALWVDALNSGAFDVLAGPTSPKDVFRTLSSAWRSWKERAHRRVPAHAVACI